MCAKPMPLRMTGVRKRFGNLEAVSGCDLTVSSGEIVTLLGPSGCGKTTTLRLIAGFERPDAGEIAIAGRVVASSNRWVPPEKRGVGMVFQEYALFPHLTVSENIAFGLGRLGPAERRRRTERLLRMVGLGGLEDRYPHSLSGGQQQRVALARALAPQPDLVLLDEPFSNLDATLRLQMREEVRRVLKETGAAAIFVTHDQSDALAISDRVAVMAFGRIEQIGTPRDIYAHPRTSFVASFIGQTNLLVGTVAATAGRVTTQIGDVPCGNGFTISPGSTVTVSLRPEAFHLDPRGPVQAIVRRARYAGNCVEAEVEAGRGTLLFIRVPPTLDLQPSQTVQLRIDPSHVTLVEDQFACATVLGVDEPAPLQTVSAASAATREPATAAR